MNRNAIAIAASSVVTVLSIIGVGIAFACSQVIADSNETDSVNQAYTLEGFTGYATSSDDMVDATTQLVEVPSIQVAYPMDCAIASEDTYSQNASGYTKGRSVAFMLEDRAYIIITAYAGVAGGGLPSDKVEILGDTGIEDISLAKVDLYDESWTLFYLNKAQYDKYGTLGEAAYVDRDPPWSISCRVYEPFTEHFLSEDQVEALMPQIGEILESVKIV